MMDVFTVRGESGAQPFNVPVRLLEKSECPECFDWVTMDFSGILGFCWSARF